MCEAEIEGLVFANAIAHLRPTAGEIGKAFRIDDALGRYNVFLKGTFPKHLTLDGLKLVVDCAHGAAYRVGPEVLAELGADVVAMGVEPDGENINRGCGALHPEGLAAEVRARGADLGVALDGDGDRAIFVDERGEIVDGDEVLAMVGVELHARGRLWNGGIVATVMSNVGLEVALRERGIKLVRVQVGDRYVVEEMLRGGYNLGGEQSGHIVFLDHGTTGDGLVTALAVLALMVESGQRLSELRTVMRRFPQILVNVPVKERRALESLPEVQTVIARISRELGDNGRVLVRYSGTEPLIRVMVEGEHLRQVEKFGEEIATTIRAEIGGPVSQPASGPVSQ